MEQSKQKNFRVPPSLQDALNTLKRPGTKDLSQHASAAIFLYLAMPGQMRRLAQELYIDADVQAAISRFWATLQGEDSEYERVREVLVRSKAREEALSKTKGRKPAKSV